MEKAAFTIRRLAYAYYFACPGLVYGIFTARMPALKNASGANDAQIGILLLCLGLASLAALFGSNALIARIGSGAALRFGSLFMFLGTCLYGLAQTPIQLGVFCAMLGFGMGLTDVAMNAQGIILERRYQQSSMSSSLHASYSMGGVAGSIGGALFAGLGIGYFATATSILAPYAALSFLEGRRLLKDPGQPKKLDRARSSIPLLVVFCGLMSMLSYAIEGSVGEWGSILLYASKGASEQIAALVFAIFSVAVVIARLFGDSLRVILGDFPLVFIGAILAFAGLSAVLYFQNPVLYLGGYAIMGFGLAPLVPVFFSRAGSLASPGKASAIVSIMSYSGLLFFPPLLGLIAQKNSLPDALLIVLLACALVACGSFVLKNK